MKGASFFGFTRLRTRLGDGGEDGNGADRRDGGRGLGVGAA